MEHLISYLLFEGVNQKYYHASYPDNSASIKKNGLNAELGKKTVPHVEYPKGIYMFDDANDAKKYAVLMLDDGDVWEIDITGIKLIKDPEDPADTHFEDAHSYYTIESIPPDRLSQVNFSEEEKDEIYREYE